MPAIRCQACDFIVNGDDHQHLKLMNDINKWINYMVSVQVQAGGTARHLNQSRECPPCPRCGKTSTWENVVA